MASARSKPVTRKHRPCHPATMAVGGSRKRWWVRFDRPLVWGLLYLALIPTFAFIYYTRALDFYQATATYEPSYEQIMEKASTALAEAAQRAISAQAAIDAKIHGVPPIISGSDKRPYGPTVSIGGHTTGGDIAVGLDFLIGQSLDKWASMEIDVPEDFYPYPRTGEEYVRVPYTIKADPDVAGLSTDIRLFD